MSDLLYSPVTMDRMDEFLARFDRCPAPSSDYTFTNLWGWAEEYGLEWAWSTTHVWVRQTRPNIIRWAPLGPWTGVDWAQCPHMSQGGSFHRVPQGLAEIWQNQLGSRVVLEEARGHWDYLYSTEDLTTLAGNRFHKKKNHVNQFKKQYAYEYHPLTPDCVEHVIALQEEWCQWRECEESEALLAENEAIVRVLEEWDVIPGLVGGALYVEGEMVAYTVGEKLTEDTLVVHFEKGRTGYRGVYQAINNLFVTAEGAGYTYINREQDLDDEGLRKAKLTYNPVDFIEKYAVHVSPA
ncbi:DUF2156 domain-containing protein [Desulfovibrio psychrotolerans]|uniref:Phosphatidylglycerol lysyltransferase C-terminal domain-containing protein n=1 Tax=Desulfovibrio psychrotolerans TaxID=415242 RepID=A0A7J0BU34_9BACT|nr:phosphatidylglycerol lysyltransferase domain-containing protein [Desulfovibrio psychrotolerans]GFM37227.1 hypothetical protein DSM19430T_19110 [Desulfovibrio psychrotolerans]